jgi:hypothetical protein
MRKICMCIVEEMKTCFVARRELRMCTVAAEDTRIVQLEKSRREKSSVASLTDMRMLLS